MARKPIFFTSDLHIGHENSIRFDGRPFRDLEHMHNELIRRFNNTVPVNGLTYFLGDVQTHSTELTKAVLSQMNGTKVLVVGNHDKNYNSCYNAGFDVVLNSGTIYIQKQRVTLSHCPLLGTFREDTKGMAGNTEGENWHGEARNKRFSVANEGQFHLHGHIHSPNGGKSSKILGRQYDVGVPANNYRPVHINEIESWIMKTLKAEEEK
jgi:calcineurin-like phosphoesterase family protein